MRLWRAHTGWSPHYGWYWRPLWGGKGKILGRDVICCNGGGGMNYCDVIKVVYYDYQGVVLLLKIIGVIGLPGVNGVLEKQTLGKARDLVVCDKLRQNGRYMVEIW